MNKTSPATAILEAGVLAILLFVYLYSEEIRVPATTPSVKFSNHTLEAGLSIYSPTFAIAAVDINGDLKDDLLVGNHGYPPTLYLNHDGKMTNSGKALPIFKRDDRHGYTIVDLDNDGDRDLLYAGGGQDGIGKGSGNGVYKNLLAEKGSLEFIKDPSTSGIAFPSWRARQFHPVANASGDMVDLYLTSLHKRRKGSTNLYIANSSTSEELLLDVDESASLNQRFESNGMDLFFDYDRDGQVDFLRLGQLRVRIYKNYGGVFKHKPSALDALSHVVSAAIADLNSDGYPDLYLGGISGHTNSDNVSSNAQEIHFVIVNQDGDDFDRIAFSTTQKTLAINFVQHLSDQGKNRTDATDIFLGASNENPLGRSVIIEQEQAAGTPKDFDKPGTYIWFETEEKLWHVVWAHSSDIEGDSKGIIASQGIQIVGREDLETLPPRAVRDYVVVNHHGLSWEPLKLEELEHTQWTNDVTAADFNNDGFVDIVGVRSRDYAKENGTPFIMLNQGGFAFMREDILDNSEDDIFQADVIVHGFFNDDGLPDLFYTNGGGLLPSHRGPYQFWLNDSDNSADYLLLELEGTTANRDAIGAQVELYDSQDELIGYRELGPAYGRSQDTHKLHFGTGGEQGPFMLKILWPGQTRVQAFQLKRTGFHHIRQSELAPSS